MSNKSNQMRYLLDKNIVRYAITGLRYRYLRQLSSLEMNTLSFWHLASKQDITLFISHSSYNILQRMKYKEVQFFLNSVKVIFPTRYHTRWTRRIQEITGLTREDSAIIALASFGSNQQGDILGTHYLLTYDQGMINGYKNNLPMLKYRLQAMKNQLPAPFHETTLPHLSTLDQLLHKWKMN